MKNKYALYAPAVTLICVTVETVLYFISKHITDYSQVTSGFDISIFISGILNNVVVSLIWIVVSLLGFKMLFNDEPKDIVKKSVAIIFIPFANTRLAYKFISLITVFIANETVSYIAGKVFGLIAGSIISYLAINLFLKNAVFNDYALTTPANVLPSQNSKALSSKAWFAAVAVLVYSLINAVISSICITIYGFADKSGNSEHIYNIVSEIINGFIGAVIIILFCLLFYNVAMKNHYMKKRLILMAIVPYAVQSLVGNFFVPAIYTLSSYITSSDIAAMSVFSCLTTVVCAIDGVVSIIISYLIVKRLLQAFENNIYD